MLAAIQVGQLSRMPRAALAEGPYPLQLAPGSERIIEGRRWVRR